MIGHSLEVLRATMRGGAGENNSHDVRLCSERICLMMSKGRRTGRRRRRSRQAASGGLSTLIVSV
jgi:hypothetical protein